MDLKAHRVLLKQVRRRPGRGGPHHAQYLLESILLLLLVVRLLFVVFAAAVFFCFAQSQAHQGVLGPPVAVPKTETRIDRGRHSRPDAAAAASEKGRGRRHQR
jgi:hypothetical protein